MTGERNMIEKSLHLYAEKRFKGNQTPMAVAAVLFFDEEYLFLKRVKTPQNWCPPCGAVEEGETPYEAVHRELFEETGLQVKELVPVDLWRGEHNGTKILSLVFVGEAKTKDVVLSPREHKDFRWVPSKDLKAVDTDFNVEKWCLWRTLAKK